MLSTFEDYQAKYETSFLLEGLNNQLNGLRRGVHGFVSFVDAAYQKPDVIIKMIQVSVAIFSCFPSLSFAVEAPKQFCKEARNFSNFIKGLKSVDGMLNFQFYWKKIVLNISGMTLFILSSLTLMDRFGLLNVSAIKGHLAAIPILGVLPYGGLLPLSVIGLMSIVVLLSLDARKRIAKEIDCLKNEKLVFWQQPLDMNKVQERQIKYAAKVVALKKEVTTCEELVKEGERVETELSLDLTQVRKIQACQKALQELASIQTNQQTALDKYEKKHSQWSVLEREWDSIDLKEVENFRQAKESKWLAKLDKIGSEQMINLLSIASSIGVMSRQLFAIGTVVSGYGVIAIPVLANAGIEVVISGGGIVNFFMKRSIQKMTIPSVDFAQFLTI